jgi:hypothetical protein
MGATMVIQPKPAVTQVRLVRPADEATGRLQHVADVELDTAPLVRLAAGERDAVEMLIHTHQRETQIRLTGVTLRVTIDETAADPVTHQRALRA